MATTLRETGLVSARLDVYFATNRMIQQTFGAAGYPVPYTEQHLLDARRAHA